MTAVDKRLAERVATQQHLLLGRDVDEGKKKEIEEMEVHRDKMMEKLQEMENKVETLEVEIEEERIRLVNLNDQITFRMLKIETSRLSAEERKEQEQIKMEEEKIRDERIKGVSKKEDRVKALYYCITYRDIGSC